MRPTSARPSTTSRAPGVDGADGDQALRRPTVGVLDKKIIGNEEAGISMRINGSDFVPPSPRGMQKFMKLYYTESGDLGAC